MKRIVLILAMTTASFAQSGPSFFNAPVEIGLVSATGSAPYIPMATTGTSGTPYDNAQPILMLGYNSTTKKYYVCGASNPCSGSSPSSSTSTAIPTSGLLADFHYQDGTGTVVSDSSGNGNNGTANANTTWIPNGLDFSDPSSTTNIAAAVALPAALNATKTFLFVGYWKPFQTVTPSAQYQVILTDSTSSTFNIFSTAINQGNNYSTPEGGYQVSLLTSALNTASMNSIVGLNAVAIICGTSSGNKDRIFVNGVEANYNGKQNFSCPSNIAGSLFIGPNATVWSNGALNATMYRSMFWNTNLTVTQIQQASKAALQEVISRGVSPNPPVLTDAGTPTLNCNGDSITFGTGVTNPWCSTALLPPIYSGNPAMPNWTLKNWGISGIAAFATNLQEPYRIAPSCNSYNGTKPAVIIFLGTNDLYLYVTQTSTAPQAALQVAGSISSMVRTYKSAGCSVYVATMLSRNQNSLANTIAMDTLKDSYNPILRANYRIWGADGLIDFAVNPVLGADGAATNATYFQADGVHPNQTGQQLLANTAGATLNYYYSQYSETNPHILTATTALSTSDVAVIMGTLSGSVALTLPDCTGPTGAVFTITNPQSAQTVMVTGFNAVQQPINGQTTAVTIPSNSTVKLRISANPSSTAGCFWTM